MENLYGQELRSGYHLNIYLVVDGSTDGTGAAVSAAFPETTVISADGSLFWSGGMHVAWRHAATKDSAFYLWMNDDTYLLPKCLVTLLRTWEEYAAAGQERWLVVGSCHDPQTGEHSYAGEQLRGHHPGKVITVLPDPHSPKICQTFNGNCVLVPRATLRAIGFLRRFSHSMSDTDYGLYATHGFPVVVAPGYLAECSREPIFESSQLLAELGLTADSAVAAPAGSKRAATPSIGGDSCGPMLVFARSGIGRCLPARGDGPWSLGSITRFNPKAED